MVRVAAAPAVGASLPGIYRESGYVAIRDDGLGVASHLAERFREMGIEARVLETPPAVSDTHAPYGVIYLGGLRAMGSVDEAMEVNLDAFHWARQTGPALIKQDGLFLTVQNTGGDFGLSGRADMQAWSGGLPGLVKTAGLEWPNCTVKAIDLECTGQSVEKLAARLADEVVAGGPEVEIGLFADGRRVTVFACEDEEVAAVNSQESMEPRSGLVNRASSNSVFVVSGGARGVTAACVSALSSAENAKFALLGRTKLAEESEQTRHAMSESELKLAVLQESQREGESLTPLQLNRRVEFIEANREIRNTLAALCACGAEVQYVNVDIQDTEAVKGALAEVRQTLGPITGLIHAAGVIADKPILQKTPDQFRYVFETKVQGLRNLLNATSEDPLRVICLFSSIAARTGNIGQADYAMANEVLNQVALAEVSRRGDSCAVKSINWGAWEAGMVTPSLKAHFERQGVPLIPLASGAKSFVNELYAPGTQVVIVPRRMTSLLGGVSRARWSMDLIVREDRFPCLLDHVIAGAPVVPVAFVLHWLCRAAKACRPDLAVLSCENMRVVKGIRLDHFKEGHVLRLVMSESGPRETMFETKGPQQEVWLAAELFARDGALHYQATIRMASQAFDASREGLPVSLTELVEDIPHGIEPKSSDLRQGLAGVPDDDPYQRHLFHGPAFTILTDIRRVSEQVVTARLKAPEVVEQMTPLNSTDTVEPILLDGGLQVARLWGTYAIGRKTLPTSLGRYRVESGVPTQCVVIGQSATPLRTVSDVYLLSADERVVAAMTGLEMHVVGDVTNEHEV